MGDVVAVFGGVAEGVASAAEVGPEGGVGVGGLFVLAEFEGVDEDDDLGAVDLEVEVLGLREGGRVDCVVELVDDLLVVGEAGGLGSGVNSGKERLYLGAGFGVVAVAAVGFAPGFVGGVDGFEGGVGGRWGLRDGGEGEEKS